MRTIHVVIAGMLLAVASTTYAQQPGVQPPGDPIGENFFPVELVMAHQGEIGLTEAQRSFIIAQVDTAQQRATALQWKLQREVETMTTLVKQEPLDEAKVLAQLDRVLAVERDVKRVHLALVIRLKNQLTPDQRARLRALRSGASRPFWAPGLNAAPGL
jgi:Spy/CpxP family protein refolding chaperone